MIRTRGAGVAVAGLVLAATQMADAQGSHRGESRAA